MEVQRGEVAAQGHTANTAHCGLTDVTLPPLPDGPLELKLAPCSSSRRPSGKAAGAFALLSPAKMT